MIVKEFHCGTCQRDFESGIARCPRCGNPATRVFRTAPGLGFGKAKSIDRVIEGEFSRRNISNYSNTGSHPVVNYGSGEYNGIRAGWGKQQLSQIQQQYQPLMPPGTALVPPPLPGGTNPSVPLVDMGGVQGPGWGANVPTEHLDLTPNE